MPSHIVGAGAAGTAWKGRNGGGGGGGGASSWKPDPPSTYKSTGTVAFTSAAFTGATIDTLFHPTTQHVVRTSNGTMFATGLTRDNTSSHSPSTWLCVKSTDGGSTWTTVWDSLAQGDPQYGIGAALELDENDNLYILANYYTAGQTQLVKFYKFTKASGYSTSITPLTLDTNNRASGKWSVFLDQGRQWIWVLLWSDTTSPNLFAYDYTGTKKYARQIFKTYTRDWTPSLPGATDPNAPSAHYPGISVGVDGAVYVGWTSFPFQAGDFTGANTSFYDVRMIYSQSTTAQFLAGTETWLGPQSGVNGTPSARTIPICTDDSGAQANLAYPIVKLSNQDEFIPASDPNYVHFDGSGNLVGKWNYSRLQNFVVNNGAVHFYYESETSDSHAILHHSYARFRLSTNDVADSERRTPNWKSDLSVAGDRAGSQVGEGSGVFVQDTTCASRLYFVTRTLVDGDKKILVLRSDDAGVSWWVYATSASLTGAGANGLLLAQAYRWVATDGTITGIVQYADSPYTVFVFTVTPN